MRTGAYRPLTSGLPTLYPDRTRCAETEQMTKR